MSQRDTPGYHLRNLIVNLDRPFAALVWPLKGIYFSLDVRNPSRAQRSPPGQSEIRILVSILCGQRPNRIIDVPILTSIGWMRHHALLHTFDFASS